MIERATFFSPTFMTLKKAIARPSVLSVRVEEFDEDYLFLIIVGSNMTTHHEVGGCVDVCV